MTQGRIEPLYEADGITLYCGDCLTIAPTLDRFDAIVTDPPYGETSLDWDVWPEGWPGLMTALAPHLWCFGSLRMFLDRRDEFASWKLAQDIVWEKHNGSGLHADRFRRVHEFALHFYQGEWRSLYKSPPKERREFLKTGKMRRTSKPAHFGGNTMSIA